MPDREESELLEQNIAKLMQRAHEPPRMDAEARARILGELRGRRRPATRRIWPAVAVVVALAAAVLVFFAVRPPPSDGEDRSQVVLHANDETRSRSVTLSDGSTAILRADSAIEELAPRSIVLVRGEAIFDVAPSDERFVVSTEHGEAVALGTRFAVSSGVGEIVTSVLRGKVQLGSGETLHAGESAIMREQIVSLRTPKRLTHELAWARDLLTQDPQAAAPARRGNLVARDPTWRGEWPLPIRKMKVDVYVENGIARTTIDQTFFNHVHRQLEGVYSFPLPPDAAISRLAMYVDGKLMEGGIVERDRGRNVYESIVHQRRDPALLEWMAGNVFRMRVFPLPARTEKRIVLSYTQALPELYGDYDVRVPIPEVDLPVGEFEIAVRVAEGRSWELTSSSHALPSVLERGDRVATLQAKDHAIGADLALRLRRAEESLPPAELALDGDHVMVRARPELPDAPAHEQRRWVVLYDTSASRAPEDLRAQAFFLQRFLGAADEEDLLSVVAFDSTQRAWSDSLRRVDEIDPAVIARFVAHEGREHVGETDLRAALLRAMELLGTSDEGTPHVLLLGDGLATAAGPQGLRDLEGVLREKATFVGVAIGDTSDAALLRGLADATGGLSVELDRGEDLAWRAIELVSTLDTSRLHAVEVDLLDAEGQRIATETHASAHSLADGEALVVFAKGVLPTSARVRGTFRGDAWAHTFALGEPVTAARYVPRLWARARIASLQAKGVEEHAKEITDLGMQHFLVTPTTSLLVLESEEMYKSFAVVRPSETAWAHYEAPATIPVVYEPANLDIPPGSHVVRTPVEVVAWSQPYAATWSEGTIGLGNLGLIGTGRGGGGTGSGYGIGSGGPPSGTTIGLRGELRGDRSITLPDGISPAQQSARPVVLVPTTPAASMDFKRAAKSSGYASSRFAGRGHSGKSTPMSPQSRPWVRTMSYAWDLGLDDLTEQLPAIFEDGFDLERERLLLASTEGARGSITEDARELVEAARIAAPIGRLQLDGRTQLSLARDGRFRVVRSGYLGEEIVYDGTDVIALYPEVELAIARRVSHTAPLLLAEWAPWLLPSPDQLAHWYEVTAIGPRQLSLRVRDPGHLHETIVELDESNRVVVVSRTREDADPERIEIRYTSRGIELDDGARTRTITVLTEDPGELEPALDHAHWPVVELPLRPAAERKKELDALGAGTPAWRHAAHQLMASIVAERRPLEVAPVFGQLASATTITRGDLVLASAGAVWITAADWKTLTDTLGASDPIVVYLGAKRGSTTEARSRRVWAQLATTQRGTLVGMLSAYRAALLDPKSAEQFVATYDHPAFAFVVTQQAASNHWNRPDRAAATWDVLAKHQPAWRVSALHNAGAALYGAGRYEQAAARFEQMFDAAKTTGGQPIVDYMVQHSIQYSRGGAARWRALWAGWREHVRTSGRAADVTSFVLTALTMREIADARRVLRTVDADALDPSSAAAIVDALVGVGETSDAQRLLRPMLVAHADDPDLQMRASVLAERQGRLRDAADHLDRALSLVSEDGIALEQLRTFYARLFDLESRVVQATGDEADDLERALAVAGRWRAEDPDNDQIDVLAAQLLFAADRPDDAWRQLSSITERHPSLGDAHAKVAETLEREALFERADVAWERAFAVEPTNPTWLLRRAQNRLGYGARADALLDQIADGEWQPRFAGIETQADQLAEAR